jgi:hypothetical protein
MKVPVKSFELGPSAVHDAATVTVASVVSAVATRVEHFRRIGQAPPVVPIAAAQLQDCEVTVDVVDAQVPVVKLN